MKKTLILGLTALIALGSSASAYADNGYNVSRLSGNDRYKTSVNISESFNNGTIQTVILANGENFPDALSGSLLSKKYNAPIVLAGLTPSTSSDAFEYIKNHLSKSGTVYVLGGTSSISDDSINYIKQLGYNNVVRLGGQNRFDTSKVILNDIKVQKGTPVILANGFGFADALSASSIAAIKGYPILMTDSKILPAETKDLLNDIQPSQLYVIGGSGVISDNVVAEAKGTAKSLSSDNVFRIAGNNRYDTSMNICKYFNLDSDTAVLASGENFPDALSGSALAIKSKAPVILTDGQDISSQKSYMSTKNFKNIILLGGAGSIDVVAEYSLKRASDISQQEKDFTKNLLSYCGNFYDSTESFATKFSQYGESIQKISANSNSSSIQDAENSLNQILGIFNNMTLSLNNYKQTLLSMENEVSSMSAPESLNCLKTDLVKNINSQIGNVDKFTSLVNNYSSLVNSLNNAIKAGDYQKMYSIVAQIKEANNELSKFNTQNAILNMNKLSEKIINIKHIMNF